MRRRLTIEPNPVNSVNDSTVATVDPIVPGVNMTNSSSGGSSAGNHRASTLDVIDKDIRALAKSTLVLNALHGGPVKILRANGDADNEVGQTGWSMTDPDCQGLVRSVTKP